MNTNRRIVSSFRIFLVCSGLVACPFVGGQQLPKDPSELSNLSVENQDIFLHAFGPALKARGGVGRLYVASECVGEPEQLFFPRIELKFGPNGEGDINAWREAFANIKDVAVTERQSGIIEIAIGSVSDDLLRTKISVLKLKPRDRYNELLAIKAIFSTSEVEAKMRELRMDPAPMVVIHPILDPDSKLPHLPPSMKNLTVDEALDQVAQTFRGLVIYEECTGPKRRLFRVHMHEM